MSITFSNCARRDDRGEKNNAWGSADDTAVSSRLTGADAVPSGPTCGRGGGRGKVAVAASERGTATNASPPRGLGLDDKALRMNSSVDKHSDAATGNWNFCASAARNSAITLSNAERNIWNVTGLYRNRSIRFGMQSVVVSYICQ
jgi:hypothetical protein